MLLIAGQERYWLGTITRYDIYDLTENRLLFQKVKLLGIPERTFTF